MNLYVIFSSLKCTDCPDGGTLRPLMPVMLGTPWGCDECGKRCGHRTIVERIAEVERAIKATLRGGRGEGKIDDLIERLSREQLHPNHYFIFYLKEKQLYARYKVGLLWKLYLSHKSIILEGNKHFRAFS